ncbi:uncharacterized protein PRCAT00003917001 [Priceomyces carsonii]|uniref:uncharacterized protein n=1 Tax=Priceomyces carsonii TaxID=28549 RepID=UPI002ED8D296|nr:unnamed protein product [Priceomyces carsonii]
MRLKSTVFIALYQFISYAFAYSISEGFVKINSDVVHFGEIETQELKQLPILSHKDKIEIEFVLKEQVTEAPHQVVVTLGNGKGLDASYVPSFLLKENKLSLVIAASKIPEVLKIKDTLFLNLIIGDSTSSPNLYKFLTEIRPSEEFQSTSKYEFESQFGLKPEIHHEFKKETETVNPLVPAFFIWGALLLFIGLFASWIIFVGINIFANFKSFSTTQIIYNASFILTLVGFELIVIKYYLYESIFKTLFHGSILVIPAIYFGSRVLRNLYALRKIGKA